MGFLGGASGSIGSVGGATARLLVLITGNSSQLTSELAKASGSMKGFQGNAGTLGTALTRSVTIPLLAIGTVSVASAVEFQAAMAKLNALTPIMDNTGESIDSVTDALFDMSKVTATSATGLAGTLYFAGSAGIDFNQAMQVTEMSAKAAAMGMGEAEDVARTLVAAMNAYGPAALTAEQAMDALTVAIQEGLAEPAEFAIALGRVLSIAEEAGVEFDRLVMSVAALTNIGVPTRVATTSLRAMYQQLDTPLEGAVDEMAKYGVSVEHMNAALETSPITALKLLQTLKDQGANLRTIIPQMRAYTAVTSLMGKSAGHYAEMQLKANQSIGKFNEAWEKMKETPAIKFKQALADIQNAGIQLGNALLPVFLAFMRAVQGVAKAFQGMDPLMQKAAAALLVLGAAAGPALKLFASLTAGGKGMFSSVSAWTSGLIVFGAAAVTAYNALGNLVDGQMDMGTILQASLGGVIAISMALKAMATTTAASAAGYAAAQAAVVVANEAVVASTAALASAQGAYGALVRTVGKVEAQGTAQALAYAAARETQAAATATAAAAESKLASARGGGALTGLLGGLSGGMILGIAAAITAVAVGIAYLMGSSKRAKIEIQQFTHGLAEAAGASKTLKTYIQELTGTNAAYAEVLRSVAVATEAMNAPVGVALPDIEPGLLARWQTLGEIGLSDFSEAERGTNEWAAAIGTVDAAMQESITSGRDLAQVLREDFGTDMDAMRDAFAGGVEGASGNVGIQSEMEKLLEVFNSTSQAYETYVQDGIGIIAAQQMEADAVEELASRYGVSTDSIKANLAEHGISAIQAAGDISEGFGIAMGYVDEFGLHVGDLVNQQKAWTAAAEGVRTTVGYFGELPEKIKEGTAELAKQAKEHANYTASTIRDMEKLNRAGMSSAQINEILAKDGPAMIQALAGSSRGQLRTVIKAYDDTLTAVDQLILNEADHQKMKGAKMTESLRDGIMTNSAILTKTAAQLMDKISQGLKTGKIKNKDIAIAQTMADEIRADTNIPVAAADKMVAQIYKDLAAGKNFAGAGKKKVAEYKAGIVSGKGAAAAAALSVGAAAETAISRGDAQAEGAQLVMSFASGISGAVNVALTAAALVVQAVKDKMDDSLKNSPEYFTYYMGQKVMADMGRGMKDGQQKLGSMRMPVRLSSEALIASALGGSGRGGPRQVTVNLKVENGHGLNEDKLAARISHKLAKEILAGEATH
jgi:TP901 family phage tail tape measure protein